MTSLSDQLLKAGLVTKDQVRKAAEKPKFVKKKTVINKKKKKPSDLAKFYQQRDHENRKEKQEADHKKKEANRLKKLTNAKINKLITDNLLNDEIAEIRYNFVVGKTIKYLFVNPKQQQDLADGKIAITFLGGKRSLIPKSIGHEIIQLNPNKIVVFTDQDSSPQE
ncbi:MAG: DUF2058 family protein [Cocleimonas sp.]